MRAMKTFYSSTFMSVILGFLMMVNSSSEPVVIPELEDIPEFRSILDYQGFEPGKNGPVAVEFFTRFTCDTCQVFAIETIEKIHDTYKDREVELNLHFIPNVEDEMDVLATKAIYCVEEEKYWDMFDAIYRLPFIRTEEIDRIASELEMDSESFQNCLTDEKTLNKMEEAKNHASTQNIPTIPSGVVNDMLFVGSHPFENLDRSIRKHLDKLPESPVSTQP